MKVFFLLICCFSMAFCQPFLDYAEYYNTMLDYAAYDYYDWVCTNVQCQLCDLLTGDCCDPSQSPNCFLPDSCANNPCLAGGTCISTLTVGGNADFVCTCKKGLTGKYCQLIDEYDPPITMPIVAPVHPVPSLPQPPPSPSLPAPSPYSQQLPSLPGPPSPYSQQIPQAQRQPFGQSQFGQSQFGQPQFGQPQFGPSSFTVPLQPTQQQPFMG